MGGFICYGLHLTYGIIKYNVLQFCWRQVVSFSSKWVLLFWVLNVVPGVGGHLLDFGWFFLMISAKLFGNSNSQFLYEVHN